MACRIMFRTLYLIEPCRPCKTNNFLSCSSSFISLHPSSFKKAWNYEYSRRTQAFNCSNNRHSNNGKPGYQDESELEPPQELVLKAISEVSKTEGRVGRTTKMVIGARVTDDTTNEWLELDKKVNSYPSARQFTAIGTGSHDFVHAMVVAVESVLQQPIPFVFYEQVKQKVSSGGKYVSVNIGPVQVVSGKQVQAVYNAMRRDDRMKFFL